MSTLFTCPVAVPTPKSESQAREQLGLVKHHLCKTRKDLSGSDLEAFSCSSFIHSFNEIKERNQFIHLFNKYCGASTVTRALCKDLGFNGEPDV